MTCNYFKDGNTHVFLCDVSFERFTMRSVGLRLQALERTGRRLLRDANAARARKLGKKEKRG